jgi:orotate phosphoribosyltransferase
MMVERGLVEDTDIILGPSYKGSAIALATAIALYVHHGCDLLYEYDRKEAKTHGEGSGAKSLFVNRAFFEGCRVLIVDDVATSMGTKYDLVERVKTVAEESGMAIHIKGVGIAVDREQRAAVYDEKGQPVLDTKGVDAIDEFASRTGIPVYAVAGIREIVDFLYAERVPIVIAGRHRPIDDITKSEFDAYLKTYGIDEARK